MYIQESQSYLNKVRILFKMPIISSCRSLHAHDNPWFRRALSTPWFLIHSVASKYWTSRWENSISSVSSRYQAFFHKDYRSIWTLLSKKYNISSDNWSCHPIIKFAIISSAMASIIHSTFLTVSLPLTYWSQSSPAKITTDLPSSARLFLKQW